MTETFRIWRCQCQHPVCDCTRHWKVLLLGKLVTGTRDRHDLAQLHGKSIIISKYSLIRIIKNPILLPDKLTLPYWDLSLRIHHSTLILGQNHRSGWRTNWVTPNTVTQSSFLCEFPQFPSWGLSLVRHTPSQCSHRRGGRPACRRGRRILPLSCSHHRGHNKEFHNGEASPHYWVYSNVRTLWKLDINLLYINQMFKHIADALPVKATVSCMRAELIDLLRRKCSIPEGLI